MNEEKRENLCKRTAETILTDRNWSLPEIAGALAEKGDKEYFKQLLIPCASYPVAAYRMCGLLARLYPEQATALAQVVMGESEKSINNS